MKRPAHLALRLVVAALLVALCAWGIRKARRNSTADGIPTAKASSGEFAVLVHCRGSLVAGHSIQLAAPVDIQDLQIVWLAPPGSELKAGQTVIRFDPAKTQQELREKKVALDQAQASLEQSEADARIAADQDRLDLASARFDSEKARLEASKKAIVSPMEGEKSEVDFGLAQQKVRMQQATADLHRKSNDAKIASQTRLRDEAGAEIERAQKRLTSMELKSPINGVVNYLSNRTQGWMNSAPFKVGDHVYAGLAIAEIPDLATCRWKVSSTRSTAGASPSRTKYWSTWMLFPKRTSPEDLLPSRPSPNRTSPNGRPPAPSAPTLCWSLAIHACARA